MKTIFLINNMRTEVLTDNQFMTRLFSRICVYICFLRGHVRTCLNFLVNIYWLLVCESKRQKCIVTWMVNVAWKLVWKLTVFFNDIETWYLRACYFPYLSLQLETNSILRWGQCHAGLPIGAFLMMLLLLTYLWKYIRFNS